jgi:DNA ligase-1
VIAHEPGRGRHEGRLGALQVKSEDGLVFRIGTGLSDAQRDMTPKIGSVVTYAHRGRTEAGVSRFASFLRSRALRSRSPPGASVRHAPRSRGRRAASP